MRRALAGVLVLALTGCAGWHGIGPGYHYYAAAPVPLATCAAQDYAQADPLLQLGALGDTARILREDTACGPAGCRPIRTLDATFEPHPLGTRVETRRSLVGGVPTPSWDATLGPAVTACSFRLNPPLVPPAPPPARR